MCGFRCGGQQALSGMAQGGRAGGKLSWWWVLKGFCVADATTRSFIFFTRVLTQKEVSNKSFVSFDDDVDKVKGKPALASRPARTAVAALTALRWRHRRTYQPHISHEYYERYKRLLNIMFLYLMIYWLLIKIHFAICHRQQYQLTSWCDMHNINPSY